MDCTIYVVKTKALISCAATVQLICFFVFACKTSFVFARKNRLCKNRFSHGAAHIKHSKEKQTCKSFMLNISYQNVIIS